LVWDGNSAHANVEVNFPSESGGEENEQLQIVLADVFVFRLVVDLDAFDLVQIALGANAFFWIARKIHRIDRFDAAMFRFFGDANSEIALLCGAIGIERGDKIDPLISSRWNDTRELVFFQSFVSGRIWANADDESSPNANAASRKFFILILRAQRTFML
jgi:hypothetical protein